MGGETIAANDESSIAPVSSLRSRFEQLTRTSPGQTGLRPSDGTRKLSSSVSSSGIATPLSRSRPVTPQASFAFDTRSFLVPTESLSVADYKSHSHIQPSSASREQHVSASKEQHVSTSREQHVSAFSSVVELLIDLGDEVPAARPQHKPAVPPKKPGLATKVQPQGVQEQGQIEEDADKPVRGRFSSDASWVERIQSRESNDHNPAAIDSQESISLSPQESTLFDPPSGPKHSFRAKRTATVGSDASWVENLSSTPPPSAVDRSREYRQDLSARGSFLRGSPRQKSPEKSASPQRNGNSRSTEGDNTLLDRGEAGAADQTAAVLPPSKTLAPPSLPPPRRSIDKRSARPGSAPAEEVEITDPIENITSNIDIPSIGVFPDASRSNRRPPRIPRFPWQILTGYDTRLLVSHRGMVCTSGFITRVWNIKTGSQILDLPHQEAMKVTAVAIADTSSGPCLWLGTCVGDVHQIDIESGATLRTAHRAHRGMDIIRVFVQTNTVWTIDSTGELNTWSSTTLAQPLATYRVQRGGSYSLAHQGLLWLAAGKDLRVYRPGAVRDSDFILTPQPLSQPNLGDVSSGTILPYQQNRIYLGHTDGKISIYDTQRLECLGVVHVSLSKISVLAGVGNQLWAGYGTGNITIYETSQSPWRVLKDWSAHDKPICGIAIDESLFMESGNIPVITLAYDNSLKIWDGLLQADWVETRLRQEDSRFSTFDEISVGVLTWNAGATKPSYLQSMLSDEDQLVEYLRQCSGNDILVFGFQELVDLEDKKLTAKSFFKSKRKDPNDQDHMAHHYRAWRDYLVRILDQRKGDQFVLLHSADLVGLFSCIFVKATLRPRIKHVNQADIKRGMGGHLGNKGAIVIRMIIDDSSLCFLNCHLAAGQTQTSSRNSDIAAILESNCFPAPMLTNLESSDVFDTGGDGGMILDHEICILNGDLNYRIDTMNRDTIIKFVQQGNFSRLLDRDQLLLSRKKNPIFKLRVFTENEIGFAPTYKYDVNSNTYDTSEKRRSPAWCDRVLYRGVGKVKCNEYRRWEVRISDHRPVSASLKCRIKRVDVSRREQVTKECLQAFERYKQGLLT